MAGNEQGNSAVKPHQIARKNETIFYPAAPAVAAPISALSREGT